jgi:hypothetical protein
MRCCDSQLANASTSLIAQAPGKKVAVLAC